MTEEEDRWFNSGKRTGIIKALIYLGVPEDDVVDLAMKIEEADPRIC